MERRDFPRPPGPGIEASILEEVRSLEGRIGDLRSSMLQVAKEARASAREETLRAVSQVRRDIQAVSSELRDLKEEISRDRRASKEQGAVELLALAIVSAAGLDYAVLRAREGKKRVTEGDRIGPWLVISIEGEEVTLEGPRERRTLRVE